MRECFLFFRKMKYNKSNSCFGTLVCFLYRNKNLFYLIVISKCDQIFKLLNLKKYLHTKFVLIKFFFLFFSSFYLIILVVSNTILLFNQNNVAKVNAFFLFDFANQPFLLLTILTVTVLFCL